MKAVYYFLISITFIGCRDTKTEIQKPNILFFLIDDQRNDMMGCAGHPILKTPTIDALAKKGVRFENAFVTTSICAASRASILTGLYESRHGYTFGKNPIPTQLMAKSYPSVLKDSGYSTGFIGKFGVKLEKQDSMLKEMFDYYQPSPRLVPHFVEMDNGRRHSAEIKGDQAVSFINNLSNSKPFCLSISFNAVHAVDSDKTPGNEGHYPFPEAVADLYENIRMPAPNFSEPEVFDSHPDFLKNSLNRERFFWRWDTEEKYQINMRAYYRMISGYDRVMNRVLLALKEKGLDKNTIIIFSADNGYYMGNRGFAGKWSHYEESLRVPLVIYDPRISSSQTNRAIDELSLNVDIPSTILDLAAVEVPDLYQGRSLRPLILEGDKDNWRKDFLIEHRMDNERIPKYVGVRGERYVYARYYDQNPPFEYLHDLVNDPHQLQNLAENENYGSVKSEMRMRCEYLEQYVKSDQ